MAMVIEMPGHGAEEQPDDQAGDHQRSKPTTKKKEVRMRR